MKIMSRDFTTKEKVLLLILAAILILAGYYLFVDQPVRSALDSAKSQQEELNTELLVLQSRAASLSSMQSELDDIEKSGKLGKMGSYNNSKAELDELNDILKETKAYDINFNDVTRDGDLIRRSFSLTYTAPDYDKAADIITQLCEGEWRCLISDLQFIADKDNLEEGDVKVGVTATFYETMEGGTPDSGLPADTSETSDISGTSVDW